MSDTTQFRVMDFDCPTCASTVERPLERRRRPARRGPLRDRSHRIEYDDGVAEPDTFAQTIENQGYTPQPA